VKYRFVMGSHCSIGIHVHALNEIKYAYGAGGEMIGKEIEGAGEGLAWIIQPPAAISL